MNKDSSLFSEVSHLGLPEGKQAKPGASPHAGVKVREMRQLVADFRPGDGIDPRDEAKQRRRALGPARPGRAHGMHKQEQLLSQVQEALAGAFQCAAAPVLNDLTVREVARQGGSLVVVVAPLNAEQPLDLAAAAEALEAASPMLHREVASAITRKEVPTLKFVVLPANAQRIEE